MPRATDSIRSSPLMRLSPCAMLLILEVMDILSLLRCRLVCRAFKRLVDADIHLDMRRIVRHYLPVPDDFLDALVKHNAVVSSQAALALFLRDRGVLNGDLEVCVKYGAYKAFNAYVRSSLPVVEVFRYKESPRRVDDQESCEGPPFRLTWTYKIRGTSRRYLRVVGTSYATPLGAVSHLRNSALLCFFSPLLMGCAYPALTLRRLGLHRDVNRVFHSRVASTRLELTRDIALVTKAGFCLSWDPRDFITPTPTVMCNHGIGCPYCFLRPPCVRDVYLCGCNIRYWGDRGCLMAVLDPSSAWRNLIVCPDDDGPSFTPWDWNWEQICEGMGEDPLKAEMNDYNCIQGESRIHKLTIHIAPGFVGEDMLYT